jgi:hypothetical protein
MQILKNLMRFGLVASVLTAFSIPAMAGDRGNGFRDFAGSWTCSAEHEIPPIFAQIFEFNLSRKGGVRGDLTQAQVGIGEFECDVSGSATKHRNRKARISLDLELNCVLPDPIGEVTTTETAECIGSGKTRGSGYNKLVCLDLTPAEDLSNVITLAHCDRQETGRRNDRDDRDDRDDHDD